MLILRSTSGSRSRLLESLGYCMIKCYYVTVSCSIVPESRELVFWVRLRIQETRLSSCLTYTKLSMISFQYMSFRVFPRIHLRSPSGLKNNQRLELIAKDAKVWGRFQTRAFTVSLCTSYLAWIELTVWVHEKLN